MNKLMKRILSLALALVLVFSMVGCGSGETKDEDGTTKIRITRALFNLGAVDEDQVKAVQTKVNDRLKELGSNVRVEITEYASGDYPTNASLALAAGEIDLLWTASWESTIGTNDLVPANSVYDLTNLLPGTALYNSMDEGQWNATKYNGKNYFIPVYKDNVEGYDFMFRQDLVDKYGWDISSVKTLADLEPMLADCKNEGLKYPFLTQKTAMFYRWYIDSFDFFTADATANWVAVDRDTNEVVCTIDSDEYLEFCSLMGKWADLGYISSDDAAKATEDTTTQTQDWGISWWTDVPVNDEADSRYKQDVTMVAATNRYAHSTSALGSCYCVAATCSEEVAKACVEFMGLLYTDSTLADIYTFGIEGEDFEYDSNKQVTVLEGAKYSHSMWESASATIVTPLDNEPADKADLYKDFNGGAVTSCAAGFRFDKSSVADKYAACQAVYEQYGFQLENGGYSEADVPNAIAEYKAALDEAGFEDVLAAFQDQYNTWKAAN